MNHKTILAIFCIFQYTSCHCEEITFGQICLRGTLIEKVVYGPPNFQNDGQCKRLFIRCLKLRRAINVRAKVGDEFNSDPIQNLKIIQIIEPRGHQFKKEVGRNVRAKGELEASLTGHHYTPAILILTKPEDLSMDPQNQDH